VIDALHRIIVKEFSAERALSQVTLDADGFDDFGETRGGEVDEEALPSSNIVSFPRATNACAFICISYFITLQSRRAEDVASGSTRNDELINDLLQEDEEGYGFFLLAPQLFDAIQRREYELSTLGYTRLLERFQELLNEYRYSKSLNLQLLTLHMLSVTAHSWSQPAGSPSQEGFVGTVQDLLTWFCELLSKNKLHSWSAKDRLVQFLDLYVQMDPSLSQWPDMEDPKLPVDLLAQLAGDDDVRVRFRVAVTSARVVDILCNNGAEPDVLYNLIRRSLSNVLAE
jgi:serine-protein kinase ATM